MAPTASLPPITWEDFSKLEMRIGTVIAAEPFPEARNPSYKLRIDFGEHGIRKSSAQLTALYAAEALVGRQVVAVLNFPPKQIATTVSECLVLGGLGENKEVVLLQPERPVSDGQQIG